MLCAFQVEILVRELDGVLYQALHLASHGHPTLLGDRMANEYINASNAPLIYFDSDQQEHTNRHVLNNGGTVLNLNSEGQGFADDPADMQKNFAKVIDYSTRVCLWGKHQQKIMNGLISPSQKDALITTGHPSFDLLSPKFTPYFRNESIIREHGENLILVNTSFSMFNHEMGFDYYMKMLSKMEEWKVYGTPEYQEQLRRRCSHQERTALALIELTQALSKAHPDRHIIIRPHPGENSQFYSDRVKDYSNIFVCKEHSAREWIASADAIIHHDCTTGMEALLMGKLVLQYEPYEGIEGSAALMTQIGHRTTNPDDVQHYLTQGSIPEATRTELLTNLTPYLANIESNAAKALASLADSYADEDNSWTPEPLGPWENAKCWRKHISKLMRARQPGRNGRKVRYALSKFPRLRKEEVVDKLERLRAIEPELPEVSVEQLCLNTFLIRPL